MPIPLNSKLKALTQAISYDPAGNTTSTTSGSPSTSPLSLSYSARGRLNTVQIPHPQNPNTPPYGQLFDQWVGAAGV